MDEHENATVNPIYERKTYERCLTIEEDRVIKRELHEQELARDLDGEVIQPFWAKERLRNEAATLEYVASKTTIPVPKCRLYTKNGCLHLEMERIKNAIELEELTGETRLAATAAVEEQMNSTVLPQLRSLCRNSIGSVDLSLPVFPPQRLYQADRRSWERISADSDCFVLCHNDFGAQNILICPDTYKIVSIIDWEFAGFFPSYFENPFWRVNTIHELRETYGEAVSRELAFFGLKSEDMDYGGSCVTPTSSTSSDSLPSTLPSESAEEDHNSAKEVSG